MAREPKPIVFRATALDDLRAFPAAARRMSGFQLDRVQHGEDPNDWKPMRSVGPGVREIRVRSTDGAFRVIYVAALGDAIYVLHCFQKKARKTSKADVELAAKRFGELLKEQGR